MEKKTLGEKFIFNGFECENAIVDSEFLLSLKKHPRNRPSGDIDDVGCNYIQADVDAARKHILDLYRGFMTVGFEPTVKIFRVGILNGEHYKLDGQHTIGAIRKINTESIENNGKPLYNQFLVFIKDFKKDTSAFLRELNLINNNNKGFRPKEFAYTGSDENVKNNMVALSNKLTIGTEYSLIILFGNLTSKEYQGKNMDNAKKNWEYSSDVLLSIFDIFNNKDAYDVTKGLKSKDAFITLNELVSNICHKKYLSYRRNGLTEEKAMERVKNNCNLLIKHFDMIPPTTVLSCLTEAKSTGKGRKQSHKAIFKSMLLAKATSIFPKSVIDAARELNGTELKAIIKEWAEEGKNGNNGINK